MLLARLLAAPAPLQVLDAMAGCGIRALRYGLEGGATTVWANDADPGRLPLLRANLGALPDTVRWRASALGARPLLAGCLLRGQRFGLVDLDAFGCPSALVAPALEVTRVGGVLYLASSDGRSPTGHDRAAAVRRLGASARAHPASWELALRLQLGVIARAAWMQGRGIEPLLSFSDGRTFRTAVRLRRRPAAGEERRLGLLAHCHRCGDQQVGSLLRLGRWQACACGPTPGERVAALAVSGPLWIGPLQQPEVLEGMGALVGTAEASIAPASLRRLRRLQADDGELPRCWSVAEIGRRLGTGPPALEGVVAALRERGHRAWPSGVMAGQLRSDAPWPLILASAAALAGRAAR